MDRIKQIKLAMARLKKRNFKPKVMSLEAKEKASLKVKEIYRRRKANGFCERCDTPAIDLVYEYQGKRLLVRKANMCPKHWISKTIKEELSRALSTNTTFRTVHPMVTLSGKSNANHTN